MRKKNLILGIVKGYDLFIIEPFMVSLKNTGYKGDLILFTSGTNEQTDSALRSGNAILIPFREQFPYLDPGETPAACLHKQFAGCPVDAMPVNTYRFIIWSLYISENWNKYEKIMLTDVRDVVFQKEPFDFPMNTGVSCFIEDESVLIKNCSFNAGWINNVYGAEILSEIGHLPPSCCGVTIGTALAIKHYLEHMVGQLAGLKTYHYGDDTAVHNYLVYKHKLKEINLYKNEAGPVITLVNKNAETIKINHNNEVINRNGKIVNVVHQYDRYPEVIEKVLRRNHLLTRSRKKILADIYFWEVGFNKYFKNNDLKKAFKFYLKGLIFSPFDYKKHITFYSCILKGV